MYEHTSDSRIAVGFTRSILSKRCTKKKLSSFSIPNAAESIDMLCHVRRTGRTTVFQFGIRKSAWFISISYTHVCLVPSICSPIDQKNF